MQLIQLGGIGASLAFLLLGYNLLRKEQSRPAAPHQSVLDSIQRFLQYSLIFFVAGVIAYIAIFFMERHFSYRKAIAASQLRFSAWHFDIANRRMRVSLEETPFSDSPFVEQDARDQYDVYVAVRRPAPARFSEGEYPVLIGPFDFGRRADVVANVSAGELTELGSDCIELVLFALQRASSPKMPFLPSKLVFRPKVLHAVQSCP